MPSVFGADLELELLDEDYQMQTCMGLDSCDANLWMVGALVDAAKHDKFSFYLLCLSFCAWKTVFLHGRQEDLFLLMHHRLSFKSQHASRAWETCTHLVPEDPDIFAMHKDPEGTISFRSSNTASSTAQCSIVSHFVAINLLFFHLLHNFLILLHPK